MECWSQCNKCNSPSSIHTKVWKKEKDFETFGIGISLTKITDIEPITNENRTSTSILDRINTGLEQLNVDDYEKETVACEIKGELEKDSIIWFFETITESNSTHLCF